MSIDKEILQRLVDIEFEIATLKVTRNKIIDTIGYDIQKCTFCNGSGNMERFIGNDCNGSHFEYTPCNCYKGFELTKIKKSEV